MAIQQALDSSLT